MITIWYDYDTTTIRLQSDYNIIAPPASIRREQKNEDVNFSS